MDKTEVEDVGSAHPARTIEANKTSRQCQLREKEVDTQVCVATRREGMLGAAQV